MKIAFLVGSFPKLSETFILNQITGLIEMGHDVNIFARTPSGELIVHDDVEKYKLLNQTRYFDNKKYEIPKNNFLRIIKAIKILRTSTKIQKKQLIRSLNILKFGKDALRLRTFYSTAKFLGSNIENYDIIHCHFGPQGQLAALLKDTGVITGKLITTFHGYDITVHVEKKGMNVYEHLFKNGDMFMPISDRWREKLILLGCDEDKIVLHRMGVDTKKFFFTPRKLKECGTVPLLTVARLVEKKGVEYGIQAVAKSLRTYPNIQYKIAGDGPLLNELRQLIKKLGVEDNIKLVGWKTQEEILGMMEEANILVTPSVTSSDGDQEGIPVVLMEALAQGLLVLSTQHSGIPELISDNKFGFLVPERDVDALSEKLNHLIENHTQWAEMGKSGRQHIENEFNVSLLNKLLEEHYYSALQLGKPDSSTTNSC